MLTNSTLWQRIEGFEIDDSADEIPFSARLCANGWPIEKARAAIAEYKKFIYLLCIAGSPLIPSEIVDQVWQLHLVDTRSYWTDFCDGVLARPIHRGPAKSGRGAAYHLLDQYADARAVYADEFECAPPAAFWPPVSERFVLQRPGQETDRGSLWIGPKLSGFGSVLWCAAAALLLVMTSSAELAAAEQTAVVHNASMTPMLAFLGVGAFAWLAMRGLRRSQRHDAGEGRLAEIPGNDRGRWG